MKFKTPLHILLLISLLLLTPLVQNEKNVTLIGDVKKSIIIRINSPEIKISSDNSETIQLNVTYLDESSQQTKLVTPSIFAFISSKNIPTDTPGQYLLEFLSPKLSEITIDGQGLYLSSIVIVFGMVILNTIILTKDFLQL